MQKARTPCRLLLVLGIHLVYSTIFVFMLPQSYGVKKSIVVVVVGIKLVDSIGTPPKQDYNDTLDLVDYPSQRDLFSQDHALRCIATGFPC